MMSFRSILLLITFIFNALTQFAQVENKISARSRTDYVNISSNEDLIYKNSRSPVIHMLNPKKITANKNNPYQDNQIISDIKVFNLSGLCYVKDGSGIKKLLINNHSIDIDINDHFEKPCILLPGKNEFFIESWANSGSKSYDTVIIRYIPPVSRNFILNIAINNYQYWNRLENPVSHAEKLEEILTVKYTFPNNDSNIITLYNEEATRDNIFSAFKQYIDILTPNDNLLIFFAGHGHYDADMQEGYWIPADARKDQLGDYIANSEIINFIKAIKTKHTLLISDACFAGSLFQSTFRADEGSVNYSNYEKRQSRWALTSGGIEKVEDESVFCKSIIFFLENNQKYNVLLSELSNYVIETVSNNTEQMPKAGSLRFTGHEGGQFVFRLKE